MPLYEYELCEGRCETCGGQFAVPKPAPRIFAHEYRHRNPIARQRIGYLPELTYYYRFLTAEELLRFYALLLRLN